MTATEISFAYFDRTPTFATAAGLRDALLASYPGIDFFKAPVAAVARGRDFDTGPAWGWLGSLLRTRTDWLEAAGVALQHAVRDGGEIARIALADLLATCAESVVLLEWTGPIAARWPDVRTSGAGGYAWRDDRLHDIVARQRAQWSEQQAATTTIHRPDDGAIADVSAAELAALLAARADARADQPWEWLRRELWAHAWMRPRMPAVCARLAAASDAGVRAALDWFAEEHDLWRSIELLERWERDPPAWWDGPVKARRGRKNPLRRELAPHAQILGDIVLRTLGGARRQAATPAIVDLPAISDWRDGAVATPRPKVEPSPETPPMTLARGSLHGDGFAAPTPVCTFTGHHAAIAQLLVLDRGRVLSVDRDRVALLWDPHTAAPISRHELPAEAIVPGVLVTHGGALACVVREPDALVVRTLDDRRELARVRTTTLPAVSLVLCTADLSRVLIASGGELILVSLVDGERLARTSVSNPYWEPEVLSLHAEGDAFRVRFHHVAMDMYPTDEEALFDGSTLAELSRDRGPVERLAPAAPRPGARVEVLGSAARVTLDDQPLPDLAAHARPICRTEWTIDGALLTADDGGQIHRWELPPAAPPAARQHTRAITAVRFTGVGAASFTAQDTKLWRDGALIATLPACTTPLISEADRRLIDAGPTVQTYSLIDGASLGSHAAAPGTTTIGARGRISVGLADAYPNRLISLRDGGERTLPIALAKIVSRSAPPIVHAGRLLLTQYTEPTRSISLETLAVCAERVLHVDGACWTALHPDGVTLYSAGYADGQVASWNFGELTPIRRWSAFGEADRAIRTAVLLPAHDEILVAGKDRLRRFPLEVFNKKALRGAAQCAVEHTVEEMIADAAQRRVVVFMERAPPRVIDVESMHWVGAHDGEIDGASARRSVSARGAEYGLEVAFVCGEGQWLVGWSRGLAVTPVSLVNRPLRPAFMTRAPARLDGLRGTLVDDTLDRLWLLGSDGALVRTALDHDAPVEAVANIAGGIGLSWVAPAVLVVHDRLGSLHLLRTTGDRICTLERFMASPHAPHAVSEAAAVCALPDGGLRAATLPGGSYVTLQDARAAAPATAVVIAAPFVASSHGNRVLRWDLRAGACTGAWTTATTLTAIAVNADGEVLAGEASGGVTRLN